MIMSLVNLLFMLLLAFGLLYLIPPAELIAVVPYLYEISPKGGFAGGLHALRCL